MTREAKIEKKKAKALARRKKRKDKDSEYMRVAENQGSWGNSSSISWGRKKSLGRIYGCEMGYSACELRGYCNGDC